MKYSGTFPKNFMTISFQELADRKTIDSIIEHIPEDVCEWYMTKFKEYLEQYYGTEGSKKYIYVLESKYKHGMKLIEISKQWEKTSSWANEINFRLKCLSSKFEFVISSFIAPDTLEKGFDSRKFISDFKDLDFESLLNIYWIDLYSIEDVMNRAPNDIVYDIKLCDDHNKPRPLENMRILRRLMSAVGDPYFDKYWTNMDIDITNMTDTELKTLFTIYEAELYKG